jgi:hypothetical protein
VTDSSFSIGADENGPNLFGYEGSLLIRAISSKQRPRR